MNALHDGLNMNDFQSFLNTIRVTLSFWGDCNLENKTLHQILKLTFLLVLNVTFTDFPYFVFSFVMLPSTILDKLRYKHFNRLRCRMGLGQLVPLEADHGRFEVPVTATSPGYVLWPISKMSLFETKKKDSLAPLASTVKFEISQDRKKGKTWDHNRTLQIKSILGLFLFYFFCFWVPSCNPPYFYIKTANCSNARLSHCYITINFLKKSINNLGLTEETGLM